MELSISIGKFTARLALLRGTTIIGAWVSRFDGWQIHTIQFMVTPHSRLRDLVCRFSCEAWE